MAVTNRHTAFGPLIPVDVCVALAVGLNESIVVQQLRYLLSTVEDDPRHEFEGRVWVWNSYAQWANEQIPFLSEQTIKRTMHNLEVNGIVLSRQRNSYDRTKLYSIDEDVLARVVSASARASAFEASRHQRATRFIPSAQIEPMEGSDLTPSNGRGRPLEGVGVQPSIQRTQRSTADMTQKVGGGVRLAGVTRRVEE